MRNAATRRLRSPARVATKSVTGDEVAGHFGWLAGFVTADAPASSELTRKLLGWQPTHPGLISDIDTGHYFDD